MASEAQLERLNEAHQRLLRTDFDAYPARYVLYDNSLAHACIAAGMAHDEPCHRDWAAMRVAQWLSAGPMECAA